MKQTWTALFLAAISFLSIFCFTPLHAGECFLDIPFNKLTVIEGKLPAPKAADDFRYYSFEDRISSYVVLEGSGEAYASAGYEERAGNGPMNHLVIRTPAPRDITGRLFVQNGEGSVSMIQIKFTAAASDATPEARNAFYHLMARHYENLLSSGAPGGAWFRYRAREAHRDLGPDDHPDAGFSSPFLNSTFDSTYSLFSGNQALAENLQLDKTLPIATTQESKDIRVDQIAGIRVAAIDWKPLNQGKNPRLDTLAGSIPSDQHAIFFPSFDAMVAMADEADRAGTPVLQFTETRSQDAHTRQRYERQLGVSLSGLGRLIGPRLVKSVAITGSDPYLRSGSDLAILFDPKDADTLRILLTAQMGLAKQATPTAIDAGGKIGSVEFIGARSPDRALSSYLAVLKNGTIVLTNSPAQLARLAAVQDGQATSLSTAPEYLFFRDRYKLGEADDSALLVLTDATIRRWCGPRWRIADSRRTRAAAVLADLDVTHLDDLVANKRIGDVLKSEYAVPNLGELRMTAQGAASSTYGTLAFLTPISEMKFDTVTESEAWAYQRWRDSYETSWRTVFDPIAVRFSIGEKKLAADITVMPLIGDGLYPYFIDLAKGVKLNPASADPHPVLSRIGLAVNKESQTARMVRHFLLPAAFRDDPEAWLGPSLWIYADDDPYWGELAKVEKGMESDFYKANFGRLPVGIQFEVSDGAKLTRFLEDLHPFLDKAVPKPTPWQTLKYKDQPYVKTDSLRGLFDGPIYYRATATSLLLSPSEELIKRSINRELARDAAKKSGKPPGPALENPVPLLGESLVFQVDAKFCEVISHGTHADFQFAMQRKSWSNLALLNEWKRKYPDQDPVQLYERFFHARLIDPAGGNYVWNDAWQSMASTTFGCPGDARPGPAGMSLMQGIERGNMGLTFENNGVRAKVELERTAK